MHRSFIKLFVVMIGLSFTVIGCQPNDQNGQEGATESSSNNSSAFATFDAVDAIEIVESPATGVALGWGWNRGDSEPVPTICVEFVTGEEPAQTRYMTMSEVHDSYDLMKSVGMSAEASVKTIGFEAEGKASFAKSQKLTGNKSHFVMNAIVQNGVRYASPIPTEGSRVTEFQSATNERGGSSGSIRLTDEAVKKAKNIDAFRRHCGSSFVSAIYGGAKLTALISMESSSKEEKEKLSAEMSGSGWGVKVKAKVDAAAETKEGHEQMDVSIFMTGGKGDAIPVTIQDLKTKMETISMDAYVAPKDFQIAITPYELLSNWPGKPLPDKETEFEELASYWGSYNTLYDDLQRVLDNPEQFVQISVDSEGFYVPKFCLEERSKYAESRHSLKTMEERKLALNARYSRNILSSFTLQSKESKDKHFKIAQDTLKEISSLNIKITAEQTKNTVNKTILDKCSNILNKGISYDAEFREQLKFAQDEVLYTLKKLEEEARVCSDKSDRCDFEPSNYRSPYAFRSQLPININSGSRDFNDVVDYQFGSFAKRQCQASSNDTACLSNKEIDSWAQKMGLISVNKKYQPELFEKYFSLVSQEKLKFIPAGVAVMEMGRDDVLWVNPNPKVVLEAQEGE